MKKLKEIYKSLSENWQIILQAVIIGVVFLIGCVGMYFLAGR